MQIKHFEARKREHILQSLDSAHQARGLSGLDQIHLNHEALPELDFEKIDLTSPCLGKKAPVPFYVAGMTAGHDGAVELNRLLAMACQKRGWAMGVGSQRRQLEKASSEINSENNIDIDQWTRLRKEVPDLILFANIGISQLITTELSLIRKLVRSISAQALVVHTNALQEAIQKEGTPQFKGGIEALKKCCSEIGVPVVLKETGCGFSSATLKRLATSLAPSGLAAPTGLAAIDVSGLGGTHWGRIEGARAGQNSVHAAVAETFANWGEPTASSVLAAVENLGTLGVEIWASGGVRSGLDAAKLIALGAHRVGYAQPALQAALKGSDALDFWMQVQEYELRTALFCTGSATCDQLRQREGAWRIDYGR